MKKVAIALLLTIIAANVAAQFDGQVSQYWASKTFYNPATAGSGKSANAFIQVRKQWVGMPGAPKTVDIGLDFPITLFGKSQGVGINIYSDEIGLFTSSSVMLSYAYKFQKWGGTFAVGPQIGVVNVGFKGSASFWDGFNSGVYTSKDPAVPTTTVQAMAMDFGLGVYFTKDKFYSGISVTHALEPTLDLDEKSTMFIGKVAYLTAGYEMPVEDYNLTLLPSFLYKTDFRVSQLDMTLRAELDKKFSGGISYRWNNAVVLMVGTKVNDISIGYAYDISTSKLFSVTSGSHEVYINYAFDFLLPGKNKRKINKSIRYL